MRPRCARWSQKAAGEAAAAALRIRAGRGSRLGGAKPRRPAAGARRPLHRAWRARPRPRRAKRHRHRDRGGARLRHRPSRHHARLPAGARRSGEAAAAAARARCRHRLRRAGDRGGEDSAHARSSPATSTASRSGPRAPMRGSIARRATTYVHAAGANARAIAPARALRSDLRQYPARRCMRLAVPLRRSRPGAHASCCPACCRATPMRRLRSIARKASRSSGAFCSKAG